MKNLDRSRPCGDVNGAYFGARFYQDGHYYDASGVYLFSNPGTPAPAGCKARVKLGEDGTPVGDPEVGPEDAPPARAAVSEPVPTKAAAAAAAAPAPRKTRQQLREEAAAAEAAAQPEPTLTREQTLNQFSVNELRTLVKTANGPSITGAGAKAKMVDWLLKNTEE